MCSPRTWSRGTRWVRDFVCTAFSRKPWLMSDQCSTSLTGARRTIYMQPQLSTQKALLYAAGSIGTGAFYAFNNFVLPTILKAFGAPDLLIGLLASTRSLEGAVIQPVVGGLSDRAWTPLGRRRPF